MEQFGLECQHAIIASFKKINTLTFTIELPPSPLHLIDQRGSKN